MLNLKEAKLKISSNEFNIVLDISGEGMLLNELKINRFINKDSLTKEITNIENFIKSKNHYYPLSAHWNIDINLRKLENDIFIELDYEMGIKEHFKIDWMEFKKNLLAQ